MKTQRVCKDFLRLHSEHEFDAMQAAWAMLDIWGIKVDWHEMSYALDDLERIGQATRTGTGSDRFAIYRIA